MFRKPASKRPRRPTRVLVVARRARAAGFLRRRCGAEELLEAVAGRRRIALAIAWIAPPRAA